MDKLLTVTSITVVKTTEDYEIFLHFLKESHISASNQTDKCKYFKIHN